MKPRTTMTTVNGRPTSVPTEQPVSSDGIFVPCRLASGEDVCIPLRDLFALFETELVTRMRMKGQ